MASKSIEHLLLAENCAQYAKDDARSAPAQATIYAQLAIAHAQIAAVYHQILMNK